MTMNLTMREECTGAHGGQKNMTLTALNDGVEAGHVDWVLYDEMPSISMIKTEDDFKRKGVATAMLQKLQSDFPETPIRWGDVATPEGAALIDKITFTVPNPEHREALAELRTVRNYIDFMSTGAAGDDQPGLSTEQWNDLHDKHKTLSESVERSVSEFTFVRGAGCPAEQIFRASEALRAVEKDTGPDTPKPKH